jgi:hypothetical protein
VGFGDVGGTGVVGLVVVLPYNHSSFDGEVVVVP